MSGYFDRAAESVALVSAQRVVDALSLKQRPRSGRDVTGFSIRRLLDNLAHDRRTGYLEAEISADLERSQPVQHGGLLVPWEALTTRADIAGTLTAGGYLIEAANMPAADALRPNMVCGALGATFVQAPYGANVSLPRLTGTSTANWLSTEQSAVSEVEQVFGQIAFSPHTIASYTEISRQLLLQAAPSTADSVVARDLTAVVARAADYAALFGSGVNGQPRGLATAAGVSTFSGTSLNLPGIVTAAVALGDALDDSAGIATNRGTAGVLAQRQILGGSERVWMGSLVAGTSAGYPARSSSQITSGSLFLGSWRYLNFVIWGEGLEVAANPYAAGNFKSGIVGVRCFLTCDVAPTFPLAFNYAAAVT